MAISSLPTPPSRSDPESFPERADAFMAALPRFAIEANALQQDVTQSALSADQDATAAATSASAADSSRTAAQSSAAAAASSLLDASQKASESGVSAALARQWATKVDEPVDSDEFSAKHYARLAAQGAGLPVRFLNDLPTTNIGPIAVPMQGQMEWVAARSQYEVLQPAHGQCRLTFVSAAECRLMPYNGNGLVINGRQYRIPSGGIPLPIAAVAGGIGSTNYIYAKDDGSGGISLEGVTSNHARHSDGVEIKSGDPTRTLVGMTYKNASGQFQFDGFVPGVASWFNRYSNVGRASAYLAGTSSASPVPVGTAINAWVWSGEALEYGTAGVITSDTAGVAPSLVIFLDGVADVAVYGTIPTAGGAIPAGLYAVRTGLPEGFHYIEPRLSSGGSGTAYLTCGYFVSNKR